MDGTLPAGQVWTKVLARGILVLSKVAGTRIQSPALVVWRRVAKQSNLHWVTIHAVNDLSVVRGHLQVHRAPGT